MKREDFTEENGTLVYRSEKGLLTIREDNGLFNVRFQEKNASFNCLKLALICAQAWIQ